MSDNDNANENMQENDEEEEEEQDRTAQALLSEKINTSQSAMFLPFVLPKIDHKERKDSANRFFVLAISEHHQVGCFSSDGMNYFLDWTITLLG